MYYEVSAITGLPSLIDVVLSLLPKHEEGFWVTNGLSPAWNFEIELFDPIHGMIVIKPPASYIFAAPAFTRTSNIYQLSTTRLRFSGASHTRLAHQIGVYHIIRIIYGNIVKSNELRGTIRTTIAKRLVSEWPHALFPLGINDLNNPDKALNIALKKIENRFGLTFDELYSSVMEKIGMELIGIAGLLHDIGHGGWGHILDALNGIVFKILSNVADIITMPLARTLLEIQKLDITSAIYVLSHSEQLRTSIKEGFNSFLIDNIKNPDLKDILDRMNNRGAFSDVISTIITEDLSITAINGRLHSIAVSWLNVGEFRGGKNFDNEALLKYLLFAIIAEFLYVISMLGIQLLDDKTVTEESYSGVHGKDVETAVYGFNVDRLDWVPRDTYNLGLCNIGQEGKLCVQRNNLRKNMRYLYDPLKGQNPLFTIETKRFGAGRNGLIYILRNNGNEKVREIYDLLGELRTTLYDKYHDRLKSVYDSILIRAGYSSFMIVYNSALKKLSKDVSTRVAISFLLNNDEEFISESKAILRATEGEPRIHGAAALAAETNPGSLLGGAVSNDLINSVTKYFETGSKLDFIVSEFNNIYRGYSQKCGQACKYIVKTNYFLASSSQTFRDLLDQGYVLVHSTPIDENIEKYHPIRIGRLDMYPNKLILIKSITMADLEKRIQQLENENHASDIISNNLVKLKEAYSGGQHVCVEGREIKEKDEIIKQLAKTFSNLVDALEISFIEFLSNLIIKKTIPRLSELSPQQKKLNNDGKCSELNNLSYVYVNYVHYLFKDLSRVVDASSEGMLNNKINEKYKRIPLFFLFIVIDTDKEPIGNKEKLQDLMEKLHRCGLNKIIEIVANIAAIVVNARIGQELFIHCIRSHPKSRDEIKKGWDEAEKEKIFDNL